MKIHLIAFLVILIVSCSNSEQSNNEMTSQKRQKVQTDEPISSFESVKKYIHSNGTHEQVSASSMLGDSNMLVDYYFIYKNEWKITSDHSNYLYFSKNNISYGNILFEDDTTTIEVHYFGGHPLDTITDIKLPIQEIYEELISEASKTAN